MNATCEGTWRSLRGGAARPLLHGGTQKRMLCAPVKSERRSDDVKPPKCTLTGLQPLPDIRRRTPPEPAGRALHDLHAPSARGAVGSEAHGRHRRPLADGARPRLRPDRLVLVEHHSWSCVAGRHSSDAVLSNRLHVMQIGRTIAWRARPEPCGVTDDAPQPRLATARAASAMQSSDVHLTAYAQASPDLRLELCERVPRSNLSGDLSILRLY